MKHSKLFTARWEKALKVITLYQYWCAAEHPQYFVKLFISVDGEWIECTGEIEEYETSLEPEGNLFKMVHDDLTHLYTAFTSIVNNT